MRQLGAILVGCMILCAARQAGAVCKMVINVDRTGSMMALRADGVTTKCSLAQNSVMLILDAYLVGKDFDITQPGLGQLARADFDTNCPAGPDPLATAGTRLVQVREFQGTTMAPLWIGFLPVDQAITAMLSSGWYDGFGASLNSCPGPSTPMAQAMCRAAFQFPMSVPAGEFRIAKTSTDGLENSSDTVPVDVGEPRCRMPGDTE